MIICTKVRSPGNMRAAHRKEVRLPFLLSTNPDIVMFLQIRDLQRNHMPRKRSLLTVLKKKKSPSLLSTAAYAKMKPAQGMLCY